MKKAMAIILTLLMLCGCAAQGEQAEVQWKIGTAEEAEEGSCRLSRAEDGWLLTADWLDPYAVLFDGKNGFSRLTQSWSILAPGATQDALLSAWTAWTDIHTGEERNGLFTGDAFDQAHTETTWRISWADVGAIVSAAAENTEDEIIREELKEAATLSQRFAIRSETQLVVRSYDGNQAFSLTVLRGDDTVGILSLKVEDQHAPMRIVIGWAEGGKDYYIAVDETKEKTGSSWHGTMLADDNQTGFRALGEESLICTWEGKIMLDDGHQELMATLKAGNGIGPFGFRMTCSDEQITAELSMGEDSTPILLVTAKKQEASPETGTQEKTIFHYGEMSAEENSKLRGILYGKAIGIMYRMMKILPEEVIKVILPEI